MTETDIVVGSEVGLSDAAAVEYAKGFYREIGRGETFRRAHISGLNLARVEMGAEVDDLPNLMMRQGVSDSEL